MTEENGTLDIGQRAAVVNHAPKILIVDDTASNVELVQAVLCSEGFQTLTAEDGVSARRLCETGRPDLVLLDVFMPGESGFETCARLKSNPLTADIPIIFLSALDDVKSKVSGLKIGGVDYISKPVHGEEILARVRVHLRIQETNRRLIASHRARLDELRDAQQAILVRPEDCVEAAFGVHYKPLEETGGDFYDVTALGGDAFAYFVADISGHGISAAFLTSAVKVLLRQYAGPMYSPEDTMRGVDSVMRQVLGEEQYLTACYARLNRRTRRLTVVSAGHPPVIVVRASGAVETLETDSEPLGVFSAAVLKRKSLTVSRGDRIFLYTDGLIESKDCGRSMGLHRLIEACVQHRKAPLQDAARLITRDLRPGGRSVEDDLLLLVVETCP